MKELNWTSFVQWLEQLPDTDEPVGGQCVPGSCPVALFMCQTYASAAVAQIYAFGFTTDDHSVTYQIEGTKFEAFIEAYDQLPKIAKANLLQLASSIN
jgi:hypothetical protein